ncbi:polyprenyl synthetase [Natrinema sp. LN54]|uniref:polyprenyl synthetase n=1 Tax=Natrinema sp. LN54 TaxID=3458705 RepID=UPI004036EEEF
MAQDSTRSERRLEIDRRLEEALGRVESHCSAPVRATVTERDDRRYGQLVALSHDSIAETPDRSTVLPAATSIELFRGYSRLREQLLSQLDAENTALVQWDVTTALLASDYLYTTAYSTLGTLDDERVGECFEILASVSAAIIEALGSTEPRATPETTDHCSVIDGTAGALGRGAALLGATLADIEEPHREHVATVGRGFGTVSRIRAILASDTGAPRTDSSSSPATRQLRRHATRRLNEVDRALDDLSPVADIDPLRAFVREAAPDRLPARCRD